MKRIQVWYHANCLDGFGAAYAAWKKFGTTATYTAVQYGESPPDVEELDELYILDFSFKYDVLLELSKKHKKIILIDHHKTFREDIVGKLIPPNVYVVFDMNQSGAVLSWMFFHPMLPYPLLFAHIQDRDLWNWRIPDTKDITAALDSYPKTFEVWKSFMCMEGLEQLRNEGATISRYRQQQIDILVNAWEKNPWYITLGGKKGPLINGPYFLTSELLHELGENRPFAANAIFTADKVLVSLRSASDGIDVSAIANLFGGGGHEHAAGLSMTTEELEELT